MEPVLLLASLLAASPAERAPFPDHAPITCSPCEKWNAEQQPFRLFGNSWYVGTKGLSAVLVTGSEGHVLLDGGLPQSAARIAANIEKLGFKLEDVTWVLNSHAHYDHAGGIAALASVSHASVGAGPGSIAALEQGKAMPDDPQAGFGEEMRFPPVPSVRGFPDGEVLKVGDLRVTAHATPGHTPGSTTWSWRSCEGERCLDLVYADSLNPVSAPGFRFSDDAARVAAFRTSIAKVAALPCDLLVTVHPEVSRLLERRTSKDPDGLIDAQACRRYAAWATGLLDRRLAEEASDGAE